MAELRNFVVKNLSCQRAEQRLFGELEFSLDTGQALQINGPNGSGKTTLLKTLCGLRRPDTGQVCWGAQNIHEEPEGFAQALTYIAHENGLNLDLTPRENLRLYAQLRRAPADIEAALRALALPQANDRVCRNLSAGQRRRVALARLNIGKPPLWILDEPAAALDADARTQLGAQLAVHLQQGGMVIFTTHEPLPIPGITPLQVTLNA